MTTIAFFLLFITAFYLFLVAHKNKDYAFAALFLILAVAMLY